MLELILDTKKVKKTNIFFFAESLICLKKLDFLKLEKPILDKIKKIIKEKKSETYKFFLGNTQFENLFFFYYSGKEKKTILEFLGEHISELPDNFTIIPNEEKNIQILLDISILGRYKFQKYLSEKKEDKIYMLLEDEKQKKNVKKRLKTLENIIFTRDLVETPASDLSPEIFANIIKNTKFKNTKVKILGPKDVEKKGMGLLYGVGKGSINKPYFVILEKIVDKKLPTIGLVGKGIIFDTGGLDIKPEEWMYPMKDDMGGAATVFGIMKELDEKDLKVNLVAGIPLAENSVSGESYRPSDILTSYSGKTVHIGNTDAEGRLVLGDAVAYLSKNYDLTSIISLATLTGACLFALGFRYAGMVGDDKKMINKILEYSKDNFEKYVELPFDDYFIEKVKSKIADLDNRTKGIYAGPSMGGAFIYNFLTKGEKFVHIDIAGVVQNRYETYGLYPQSATGFGVESLSNILSDL
ncbi:leucyl aminopeptidase family protein [Candidatus Gracilibacteria bacterium]|nr:leucyl aminopeptidase family protein [Candidatus Gracilibacteria bacterium]NUJ98693.1 leucyl aminopeptidase family protein [Candidatus Gracilibacteria bacterium]